MVACLLCLLFACNLLPVLLAGKGSSSCVFPFIFNRRPYSSCTRDGAIDEQLWCSTTSNYDTDGRWKHCILQEHGGNSGGKSCVFPFVYKNQTFYTCTKEEKGRFWCATTRNYDKDLEWSYCADTRLDANPKGPCVFPFIFNHTSYSSCTTDGISNKKPWCSLTKNYDIDFQWAYCEPSEPKEEDENLSCTFPFVYDGKLYFSCTTEGRSDGKRWCATTINYDLDKKWKFCPEELGTELQQDDPTCVFPFIYKGKFYNVCIDEDMDNGKFWCSTSSNYDKDKKWQYCNVTNPEPNLIIVNPLCVFPFIYKSISYNICTAEGMSDGKLWCATTSNFDLDSAWVYCNITDAEPKEMCVFPFLYNQNFYFMCTTDGMFGKTSWCSLTQNYNSDLQWTYCEPSGPDEIMESPPCIFPFIYQGKLYRNCTADGRRDGKFWCATTQNYDVDRKLKLCQDLGPDPMIQSPSCVFPFIFKEKIYSTCTNEGMSDGKFWCATTNNYDVDKKWAYCNDTGPAENVESLPCVFPFVFKNQVYTGCTTNGRSDGRFWCATSSNYDIDKMWRFCSEESGPDPNVEDPTCIFPFIYKDKLYTTCTGDGMRNGRCWCATTSNYDVDKKWTYCNITDPDPKIDGPTCVFPFIYNGNSYTTCISNGMRDGKKWCATTGNYDVDKKWMCCNDTGPGTTEETHKCVFPFTYNDKSYNSCTSDGQEDGKLWCAITKNYDVDKRMTFCTITKTGCVFPFIYKGKQYESCTTMDHNEGKTWCATTPDYKSGLKWRLCNEADCVFPFIFRGQSYDNCTSDGRADNKKWCSLTGNADANHSWLLC
ncbi:uncharacterized protein LOC117668957 isoform X2 [Pantherophis guttatus]|uniref:Uncharacterized protein LOC117668957 isoform X2 n=1 Tax=Pantherophis guttatus TaxID=94885 RepID=A0ABM3ZMM4_PANGU|nr:uncharacterized protein LOC117668957 isoform X2 [Pantherophis guttatus]